MLGSVTVTARVGPVIPTDFAGFSIEYVNMTKYFGKPVDGGLGSPPAAFWPLLENLGGGSLRVGGNSADESCLDGTDSPRCAYHFSSADLAQINQTAQAVGWPVILGINLGLDDPGYAVREVDQVIAPISWGNELLALEIGNEPDGYAGEVYKVKLPDGGHGDVLQRDAGYGLPDIESDVAAYATALSADSTASSFSLSGPAFFHPQLYRQLSGYTAAVEGAGGNLGLLTMHHYSLGSTGDAGAADVLASLLDAYTMHNSVANVALGVEAALDAGLPLQLDECNSHSHGGIAGVSNALGGALWGLDYLFSMAQLGVVRLNFHENGSPSGYSPIAVTPDAGGALQAQPLYYAMLAFAQGAEGHALLQTSVDAGANVVAWAVLDADAGVARVFLLNKDLDAGGTFDVQLAAAAAPATVLYLTGPSLFATSGVTWGGAGVDGNGNIAAPAATVVPYDPTADAYHVPLPNGSAATVSIPVGWLQGGSCFGAGAKFLVGSAPSFVAAGDFNGDQITDLAVANAGSNTISLRISTAPGLFADHLHLMVGNGPSSISVGDFNGDGVPDLAVANGGDGTVGVLLGTGAGNFGTMATFQVGAMPSSVAVGDFNGDHLLDLVVANAGDSTVGVLLGTGSGGFGAQMTFAVGAGPSAVAVGDFNGDGTLDLAVTNRGDGTVSVLLGKGDGTFGAESPLAVGSAPGALAVGDFNGDGWMDLAVASSGSNAVEVLLGTGAGGFGPAAVFQVGSLPSAIVAADLNRDGQLDLAVTNAGSGSISVLLGAGDGAFGSQATFQVGAAPDSLAVADVYRDGSASVAVSNSGDDALQLMLNCWRR